MTAVNCPDNSYKPKIVLHYEVNVDVLYVKYCLYYQNS